MNVKKKLTKYFDLQAKIFAHFGYVEDWVTIPLADHTDDHWMLVNEDSAAGRADHYVYSPDPLTPEAVARGATIYSGKIYTQCHLPRWIWRADGFTMVCADTGCDSNKYLMIFDDTKETRDKALADIYVREFGDEAMLAVVQKSTSR